MSADVRQRLATVREAIAQAAGRAGRDPSAVRIVAVTKTFPPATVAAALDAGLHDVGENYVQEAMAKRAAVAGRGTWHLIGGLQRNKVRAAVATFDCLHTVDSVPLVAALAAEATRAGRRMPILIQVKAVADRVRPGVPPEDVEGLAAAALRQPSLVLDGLMIVPPPGEPRVHFRLVREVRDSTGRRLGVELPHLSMGMSSDFTVAVEEGATLLRLGRALFGARGAGSWRPGSSAEGEGS